MGVIWADGQQTEVDSLGFAIGFRQMFGFWQAFIWRPTEF
jgi:hypothetical protein